MKNRSTLPITAFLVFAILASSARAATETWNIDPDHSNIEFRVRHMMISNIRGEFRKFSGTAELDDADITKSRVRMTIETGSIDTGLEARDNHLRTEDFLDVANYPAMTFVSSRIVKKRGGKLKLYGDLTLHGITRQVVLDVIGPTPVIKDRKGNFRRGSTATGKINRKDFGITWQGVLDSGGALVGDEVMLTAELEMVRK
jgi:polyisoprenoid-binding protein YceI